MVFQSAMLLGIDADKSGNNDVLEGSILIVESGMRYMYLEPYEDGSCEKTRLERVLGRRFKEKDPVVEVWAYHDKFSSGSWSNIYYGEFSKIHPKRTKYIVGELEEKEEQDLLPTKAYTNTFPRFLPALLFDGIKEGDEIEFEVCGLPVKLKCKQLPRRYEEDHDDTPVPFHEVLKRSEELFVEDPNFGLADEEILIKKGIIVRDGTYRSGMYIYKHGTNGYRKKHKKSKFDELGPMRFSGK